MPKASSKKNLKLSFQKEYCSDMMMEGMLLASLVRAPVSSGRLKAVFHPALPEGCYLCVASDFPGDNRVDTATGKVRILCDGLIAYKGQPVAVLAAPDQETLDDLLKQIVFEIEEESTDETPSNLARREIRCGPAFNEQGAIESGGATSAEAPPLSAEDRFNKLFEEAKHVCENEWTYELTSPDYGETGSAFCYWKEEILTVCAPTQWISNLRKSAAQAFAVKPEAIVIKKTASNAKSTNAIWETSLIACQASLAALKAKKPVKLVFSRDEQDTYMNATRPVTVRHKTAASETGQIEAMKVEIDFDAGAANPFAGEIVDRLAIAAVGCYKPKNLWVICSQKHSANPPSSLDYQTIDAAAFFALENQMNEVCKLTDIPPLEFRKKNFSPSGAKEDQDANFSFEIEKFPETLDALAKCSDFARKHASFRLDALNWKSGNGPKEYASMFSSPIRGIGFSCAFEGSGYFNWETKNASRFLEVTLERENCVLVRCPPISDAVKEIWETIAAGALGVSSPEVKIDSDFKSDEEPVLPENAYSGIGTLTRLFESCCEAIKRKKARTSLPFTVKKKITDLKKTNWDSQAFSGDPFLSLSFAAVSVEIEINPCTYRETIKSVDLVINGGRILNTKTAAAAVRLSVQRTLSALVRGETVECRDVKIRFMQSQREPAQIGELACQAIPAAYTQALSQALNCTFDSLPLETYSLYAKIKEQKAKLRIQIAEEAILPPQNIQGGTQ